MIFDTLANSRRYESLHPLFGKAFDFLSRPDVSGVALGNHELAGADLVAMVQDNALKAEAECRWESHRKFIDIQYVVGGDGAHAAVEGMGVCPIERLQVERPYDEAKDVAFFVAAAAGEMLPTVTLWVPGGSFAIFFPTDGHRPLVAPAGRAGTVVRKIVMKVRV